MKNLIRKALLSSLAVSGILASAVSYAGLYAPGSVTISSTSTTLGLSAMMSVRYNSSYPNSYVRISGSINGTITIAGGDESGGYFYCYVSTSNSMYAAAVDIKNSATNGAYLVVARPVASTECSSIYIQNSSVFLD